MATDFESATISPVSDLAELVFNRLSCFILTDLKTEMLKMFWDPSAPPGGARDFILISLYPSLSGNDSES